MQVPLTRQAFLQFLGYAVHREYALLAAMATVEAIADGALRCKDEDGRLRLGRDGAEGWAEVCQDDLSASKLSGLSTM